MKPMVYLSGGFDDFRSDDVRFLQEASRLGELSVLLWTDEVFQRFHGHKPRFPIAERLYILQSIRYVDHVTQADSLKDENILPVEEQLRPLIWAVSPAEENEHKRKFCTANHIEYRVIHKQDTQGFPVPAAEIIASKRKRVVVTGCFDWLHSGHIRFFEEVSSHGDLYVVVGNDKNVGFLKGEGHPMLSQQERIYMVQAVRFVSAAMLSSGFGWLDARPEIERIKPDYYAVNEDGDQPEKRAFCEAHGIEYIVLRRTPKNGLPERNSTDLRSCP
jgi:cytidyltransferase-like protein